MHHLFTWHPVSRIGTVLVGLLMLSVGAVPVAAQVGGQTAAQTYTSSLTNQTVSVSGSDWAVDGTGFAVSDSGNDILSLESGNGAITVMWAEGTIDPSALADALLDGADYDSASVYRQDSPSVTVLAYAATTDAGNPYVQLVRLSNGIVAGYLLAEMLTVTPGNLVTEMTSAQADVQVGNVPFLDALVPGEIGSVSDVRANTDATNAPTTQATTANQTVPATQQPQPTEAAATVQPTQQAQPTEPDATVAPTTTSEKTDGELPQALLDLGLTSLNSYTSPQFGVTIDWGDSFKVDLLSDQSLVSDASGDAISLEDRNVSSYLSMTIVQAGPSALNQVTDSWKSNISNSSFENPQFLFENVTSTRAALVVTVDAPGGGQFGVAFEMVCLDTSCGTAVISVLQAGAEVLPAAYNDVRAEVFCRWPTAIRPADRK